MAKVQNTFLKSKMNKDLDARIVPNGEYRDARNAQISKSQDAEVGNLENVLGNALEVNFQTKTGVAGLTCIGALTNEVASTVYLFLTNYTDSNPNEPTHNPSSKNFIISYNVDSNYVTVLVTGAFLNFSTTNRFYGLNALENLLFFTDNRNQPRVINVSLANNDISNINPNYYTTEDQISVAKYNPYACMELFQKSKLTAGYETTMKDVNSEFLPNGGSGLATGTGAAGAVTIVLDAGSVIGNIPVGDFDIGYISGTSGAITKIANAAGILATISNAAYDSTNKEWTVTITTSSGTSAVFPTIPAGAIYKIIFNPNPYYNFQFSGDPDFLEDKFVRFSYRFKFVDNEYSIFSPFTQSAFIPKQDGYFRYVNKEGLKKIDDQSETYRSTIVSFMENKVNEIKLAIPLPYTNYTLRDGLKISEIDILYKESDALAVKVVETIPITTIEQSAGICKVNGNQAGIGIGANINIKDIQGGIKIGSTLEGSGIPDNSLITSFVPIDPSNPLSGALQIDKAITNIANDAILTIANPNYYVYTYSSTKPTKTLPDSELVRVYDKVPVKSFAQEVAGNRVIYANFQNKLTPPSTIDYEVTCTAKSDFVINEIIATYVGGAVTGTSINGITFTKLVNPPLGFFAGMIISSNTFGVNIPTGTIVTSTTSNGQTGQSGTANITLSNTVVIPAGTVIFSFLPGGNVENTSSKIEYPNSSVKTNRNYQIGFVLSDRFGRQSSVILSENSTLYSPYLDEGDDINKWPGNSLKVKVNKPILTNLYNGDTTSINYNPGGWYSYKVVVKQTEQEYYNVYLPGIMAAYPQDQILELGSTSHFPLINDNINKIPKDLTEVGPQQRQFRSSVQLYGRVVNTNTTITYINGRASNIGNSNEQYFPLNTSDTVSTISTLSDLFDYNFTNPPFPNNFPQFYSFESNPFIAKISTTSQIGQISSINYTVAGATVVQGNPNSTPPVAADDPSNTVKITAVSVESDLGVTNVEGMLVSGQGVPEETYVNAFTAAAGLPGDPNFTNATITLFAKDNTTEVDVQLANGTKLTFTSTDGPTSTPRFTPSVPGLQYLAVYETEAVESLLDIFWETSTAGLISDLNGAIINNQEDPGAIGIDNWNTTPFTEGLRDTSGSNNILDGNGFNLIDDFGNEIVFLATDTLDLTDVTITDPVSGIVESVIDPQGIGNNDYFRLIDNGTEGGGTPGPWNIRTTNVNQDPLVPALKRYYDNVYFFPDNENSDTNFRRNFTFTFTATVGGTVTEGLQINAILVNVLPVAQNYYLNQTNVVVPDSGSLDINAKRSDTEILIIRATNGADNPDLQNGGIAGEGPPPFSSQNLTFTIIDQIFVNNGESALLNGVPIFALGGTFVDFGTDPSESDFLQCQLTNTQSAQATLPAKEYRVTVRIADPSVAAGGGFIDRVFNIDMRLLIPEDKINNLATRVQTNNFIGFPPVLDDNGQPTNIDTLILAALFDYAKDWLSFPMTLIDLTDTATPGLAADEAGWYMYAGGFFGNDTTQTQANLRQTRGGVSLLNYSGVIPGDTNQAPVVIPKNLPDGDGNQVQIATFFGDILGTDGPYHDWQFIFVKTLLEIESIGNKKIVYTAASLGNQVIDILAQAFASDLIAGAGVSPPRIINDRFFIKSHNPTTRTITFSKNLNSSFQQGTPLYIFKGVLKPDENPWYFVPKSIDQGGQTYTIDNNGINSAIITSPWTGFLIEAIRTQYGANPPGGAGANCAAPNWCAAIPNDSANNKPGGNAQFSTPTAETTQQNQIYFHYNAYTGINSQANSESIDFEII
tara:strand:- start:2028 stop:7388 length:5361 start_codon:yes stop_codon:yes gene_type:complete